MRNTLEVLASLLFSCLVNTGSAAAQADWRWQHPFAQGNGLEGVHFMDARTGTAVGGSGSIIRTSNGGRLWVQQNSGTAHALSSIAFSDSLHGTIVGFFGTVLRTTDGGATWSPHGIATQNILYGVSFTDSNTGTTVGDGGRIYRTTDGGTTWNAQSSGTQMTLQAVHFTDAANGTAVGWRGEIVNTTDGGDTWSVQTSRLMYPTLLDIALQPFGGFSMGIAVGSEGSILTREAQYSWVVSASGTTVALYGVCMAGNG